MRTKRRSSNCSAGRAEGPKEAPPAGNHRGYAGGVEMSSHMSIVDMRNKLEDVDAEWCQKERLMYSNSEILWLLFTSSNSRNSADW